LNFFRTIIKPAYAILPVQFRKQSVWVIVLMIIQALLDFINIGIFIPLLTLIVKPQFVSSLSWLPLVLKNISLPYLILVFTICILCFVVTKHIIVSHITRIKASYGYQVAHDISKRILKEQLSMDYENFTRSNYSDEINRTTYLPVAFSSDIVIAITTLISEGFIALLIVLSIGLFNYQLLTSLFIVMIPIGFSYVHGRKQLKTISEELKKRHPTLLKSSGIPLEGWLEIKTGQVEKFFQNQFEKIHAELMRVFAAESSVQASVVRMTELSASIIICFIIFWTLFIKAEREQTILLLAVYAGASFRLLPSINRILNSLVLIKSHQYVLAELQPKNHDTISFSGNATSFQDRISLQQIAFSFANRQPVLKNLSLEIKKGEKIAIVGKSGCGKSSLLLVILGILKPTSGKIQFDNKDIERDNLSDYQSSFSYVSQNPFLYDGTILQNVAFGIEPQEINEERVWKALHEVDLADFVAQLPKKENTQIHEKGTTLSGGQRQRIALARAIYSDREVLILDEVTNQLDQDTEAKVIESLHRIATYQKTILMVTHHPKLLSFFDYVLKLENGELTKVSPLESK